MIQVLLKLNSTYYFNQHGRALMRLEPLLRELDIEFFDAPHQRSWDLLWVQRASFIEHLINLKLPTVIQDTYLGPEVFDENLREWSRLPHVKYILKSSGLADPNNYNKRPREQRFHTTILHGGDYSDQPITVDPRKIRLLFSLAGWDYLKTHPLLWSDPALDHEREFDCCCVMGRIDPSLYPQEPIRIHRQRCLEIANSLPRSFVRTAVSASDYFRTLQQSKVCLSPWGSDPTCYRDYEAILLGAVVVKPQSDFMNFWPEISYVACRPDLSDLEQVVGTIVENWDSYRDMRFAARERLLKQLDDRALAARVAEVIRDALR